MYLKQFYFTHLRLVIALKNYLLNILDACNDCIEKSI